MRKFFLLVVVLALLLAACGSSSEVDPVAIEQSCTEAGGFYVAEHVECENISEETCEEMGGTFDGCGSACRHEPEGVACIMMCVPFCSFDGAE